MNALSTLPTLDELTRGRREARAPSVEAVTSASGPSRLERWLVFPLIALYGFTVQFGNLFRFSSVESSAGFSTAVALLLVLFTLVRAARGLRGEVVYQLFAAMACWAALAGYFFSPKPLEALFSAGSLLGYVVLSAGISRSTLSDAWLARLWIAIACGLLLSAGLTVIDYMGIVHIPQVNQNRIFSQVGGLEIEQASGFFPRRSAMAAVFSLAITGAFVAALVAQGWRTRIFFLLSAVTGLVCLMLTHNRSGVLGSLIAVSIYLSISNRFSFQRRLRLLITAATAAAILLAVVISLFPEHVAVYGKLLAFVDPAGEAEMSKSDYVRVEVFFTVLRAALEHPLGHGLTQVLIGPNTYINAHNIFSGMIWALGALAFIWLPAVGFAIVSCLRRLRRRAPVSRSSPYLDVTLCALGAWLLNNLTHNNISTGLAWVLLGLLLACGRGMASAVSRRTA